jgi:hypothetical protein
VLIEQDIPFLVEYPRRRWAKHPWPASAAESGFSPVYVQSTAITGMSMLGKISVGVVEIATALIMSTNEASTTKV